MLNASETERVPFLWQQWMHYAESCSAQVPTSPNRTRMFIAKQHRLLARAGLSETGGSGMYLFLWLRSASLTVDTFRDLRRLSTSSASYLKTP